MGKCKDIPQADWWIPVHLPVLMIIHFPSGHPDLGKTDRIKKQQAKLANNFSPFAIRRRQKPPAPAVVEFQEINQAYSP
jgi:hypothetical protein